MIQKLIHLLYAGWDKMIGKGLASGRNGRKLSLVFAVVGMMFVCAIIFPATKDYLTNTVFMGALVTLVVSYMGGNVLSKHVWMKGRKADCKYPQLTCDECPIAKECQGSASNPPR